MRWKSMWISYFNPLPRKEGDCYDCTACRYEKISIHSLVKRETLVFMPEMPPEMDFNPLPRKEGDIWLRANCSEIANFNPLPRKEGDGFTKTTQPTEPISIHSLVKRETCLCHQWNILGSNFNPLPRKEGDNFKDWISFFLLHISIHSLVKRET